MKRPGVRCFAGASDVVPQSARVDRPGRTRRSRGSSPLVRAPARPVVLASLRFVPASPMRALRWRVLKDPSLLAIRIAILLLAVAALADPLVTTACRRAQWAGRLSRAIVLETGATGGRELAASVRPQASISETFTTATLRDGIGEGLSWLDAAPPGRRELVIVGRLRLGDIDSSSLADVPADVGVQFLRTPADSTPTEHDGPRIVRSRVGDFATLRHRVAVDGATTRSSTSAPVPAALTISLTATGLRVPELALELSAPAAAAPTLRAALIAALGIGVPWPERAAARPVQLVLDLPNAPAPAVTSMSEPWMADVARAVLGSEEIRREARTATLLRGGGMEPAWLPVARVSSGEVLAAASQMSTPAVGDRPALLVRVRAPAESALWPLLLHRILTARFADDPFAWTESLPHPRHPARDLEPPSS